MTDVTYDNYYYRGSFVAGVVNTVVGVIEVVLLVRIALELFGASTQAPFVAWLYSVSGALLGPFAGAFPGVALAPNSVLDIVAIVAMVAYALLGWLFVELLALLFGTINRI